MRQVFGSFVLGAVVAFTVTWAVLDRAGPGRTVAATEPVQVSSSGSSASSGVGLPRRAAPGGPGPQSRDDLDHVLQRDGAAARQAFDRAFQLALARTLDRATGTAAGAGALRTCLPADATAATLPIVVQVDSTETSLRLHDLDVVGDTLSTSTRDCLRAALAGEVVVEDDLTAPLPAVSIAIRLELPFDLPADLELRHRDVDDQNRASDAPAEPPR